MCYQQWTTSQTPSPLASTADPPGNHPKEAPQSKWASTSKGNAPSSHWQGKHTLVALPPRTLHKSRLYRKSRPETSFGVQVSLIRPINNLFRETWAENLARKHLQAHMPDLYSESSHRQRGRRRLRRRDRCMQPASRRWPQIGKRPYLPGCQGYGIAHNLPFSGGPG